MSQINSKISRIFISCASEQYSVAKKIYFSLRASNYDVFFAPENLLAGEEYNRKLREEIQSSDLMIFLISPQSVEEGSYARTELRFAEEIWKNPVSKVLPVMIVDTDVSLIPEYLQAVTIFKSRGNLAAEVLATVDKLVAHASPKFPNNIVVSAWFSTFLNELIDDVKRSSNILKARIFVLEHEQPWYSNPIPKSTIFNEEFKTRLNFLQFLETFPDLKYVIERYKSIIDNVSYFYELKGVVRAIGNTDTFLESMDALINKGWYLDLFKPVTLFPGFRRFFYSEWKENNELLGRLFRKDKSKGGAGILPVLLTVTALEAAGCDLQILENPDLSKLWIHYKDYFGRVANDPEVQRASHSLILRIEELRIQTESVYLTLYEKRAKLAQQYGVPLSPEAV